MKRRIQAIVFSMVLFTMLPCHAEAAELLIPVGKIVGLQLRDDTLTVAAYDDTLGGCAKAAGVKIGDELVEIDGSAVTCAEDVRQALSTAGEQVELTVRRGGKLCRLRLTPEQTDLLGQILILDRVAQVYDPLTVDPIKYEAFRYDGQEYFLNHLWEYGKLYLQLGLQYPADYLKAWIDETKGYWNGGYFFWIYTQGIHENVYGLVASYGSNPVASLYAALFRYVEKLEILQPFTSIGLQVWAIVSCTLVNALKKRRELLLGIPLVVLAAGLWIGTPVYAEFRYAYPFFLAASFLIAVTVWEKK